MTQAQRDKATTVLHKWMTIIGFPLVVYLLVDIYRDFKETRNATIKHEQQINDLVRTVGNHEDQIASIRNYLFDRSK